MGRRAIAAPIDVADALSVRKFVNHVADTFGRLDILVNNAGFCEFTPFLEISDDLWHRTMSVNAHGYFSFGQESARRMIAFGNGGKILNISSQAATVAGEEMIHYCVSKAAVKMLTKGMALELAEHGINVNAIAPGTIETDIIKQPHIAALVEQERMQSTIPLGRMGTADDLVDAAIFLCSSSADYITGATLLVDGGILAGNRLPSAFRSANFRKDLS